jgi:hypothetical protein
VEVESLRPNYSDVSSSKFPPLLTEGLQRSSRFAGRSLSCATFLQLRRFILFISSKTSSSQRSLGLPLGLLDMGCHILIFFTLLSSAMRSTWPNNFNLCFLINPIMFCPYHIDTSEYNPRRLHSSMNLTRTEQTPESQPRHSMSVQYWHSTTCFDIHTTVFSPPLYVHIWVCTCLNDTPNRQICLPKQN